MSTIETNTVKPISGSSTLTLGESGDTVSLGSGVTAGTGLTGTTINNNADNRVITGSGTANTLEGEANLTFNGSTLTAIGDDGTTGLSPSGTYDNIVIDDNGSSGITYLGSTSANQQIRFDDSGGNRGVISYNHNGDALTFGTAGGDRVRIKQYDFCFGTTSPISTNGVTFKVGTTAGDDWISSYRTTASTPHYIHAFYSDAGGTQTAKYAVYADGTASAISDVNYKKNITDARNYLEDLEKIDVIKYNLKTDNEGEFKKLGFSAQQVETIFPNMIDADNTPLKEFYEEGDEIPEGKAIGDIKKTTAREVKLLKKEVFVPMLVKAVQELSAKVKTLETENTDIKARLTALESA